MKITAAVMMTVTLAISAALAVASVVAVTSAPSATEMARLLGAQLDCATGRAVGFAGNHPVDAGDIVKAVDKCMSTVSVAEDRHDADGRGHELIAIPLRDSERRREALAQAVRERVDLCMNAGISPERFGTACPQLFSLEQIASR